MMMCVFLKRDVALKLDELVGVHQDDLKYENSVVGEKESILHVSFVEVLVRLYHLVRRYNIRSLDYFLIFAALDHHLQRAGLGNVLVRVALVAADY